MEYAILDGERITAKPKLRAQCPCCEKQLVAKCGSLVRWHWSHMPVRHCDPWWETETDWHRTWKARFPEGWRETVLHDAMLGEKHIADVRTPAGLVVEFQHSGMPETERLSRESFYESMLWVVDGLRFANRFHPLIQLPHPDSDLARLMHFIRRPRHPMDDPKYGLPLNRPVLVMDKHITGRGKAGGAASWVSYSTGYYGGKGKSWNSTSQTLEAINAEHVGHYYIQWDRPHAAWISSECRVFIDIGERGLWELMRFPENVLCGYKWSTTDFVQLVTKWQPHAGSDGRRS